MKRNMYIFILISIKSVPEGPIDNSIGLGNGLVLNRWQAISSTNDNLVHVHMCHRAPVS